jgi:predicted membrane protein
MRQYLWGIFLIVTGIFLMLKHYLNWNVPALRIIFGLFVIFLGISILIGGFGTKEDNNIFFGAGKLKVQSGKTDYNVVFSNGVVDLSTVPDGTDKIEINTVFGESEIILPKDRKVTIKATAAFASTVLPNGSRLSFGDQLYNTGPEDGDARELYIELNTVFASTKVR